MDLSIIIVNWNTRDALHKCLGSIEAHQKPLKLETVVVDNHSADASAEMVAQCFPQARLVNSDGNLGFARGCNLGLSRASAPIVLFLNPDCEILADALQKMLGFMAANPQVGALSCRIVEPGGAAYGPGLQWFPSPLTELLKQLLVTEGSLPRMRKLLPYPDPAVSGFVRKLYGTCLMVRREVLRQVGPFDDRFFMYCEDVDLSRRIELAGWKLYYLSEAGVLHLGGNASSKAPGGFAVLMGCESFWQLMCKYYGTSGGLAYRVVTLVGAQFRLLVLLLLRAGTALGWAGSADRIASATRKYTLTSRWSLGLERPRIPR